MTFGSHLKKLIRIKKYFYESAESKLKAGLFQYGE